MGIVGFVRTKILNFALRLVLPLLLLAAVTYYPSLAAKKPTITPSPTLTSTFTSTPTDSLAVFETPMSPTPAPSLAYVSAPKPGERVMGKVNIVGKSAVENFSSYEISFAYSDNPTNTWFLITKSQQPYTDDVLGVWDTSMITDGSYDIRLRVYTGMKEFKDVFVKGVKVSNYTATETPRPTSTSQIVPTEKPTFAPTFTQTPFPTPTLLPSNPVTLSPNAIFANLARGALAVLAIFGVLGLYFRLRIRK
jgi:hypothetical protein